MKDLKEQAGGIDIYLLDQILKGRHIVGQKILDAGCGNGKNLKWFYNNSFEVYGVDTDIEKILHSKNRYPDQKNNFSVGFVNNLNFKESYFNHIICNALLHFAKNENDFYSMFSELVRVLKPNGTLFLRIASNIGLEKQVEHINNGIYNLPDGTKRFLLKKSIIETLEKRYNLTFLEPVKTTNVNDKRSMTTLVFKK